MKIISILFQSAFWNSKFFIFTFFSCLVWKMNESFDTGELSIIADDL